MAPKGSWWVKWFLASLGSRPTADCAILMFEVFTPFPWGVIILPSPPMSGWAMWLAPADEKGVGMTWGLMRGTVKTPLGRHQVSSLPGPLRRAVPEIRLLLQPGPCSEGVGRAGLPHRERAAQQERREQSYTPLPWQATEWGACYLALAQAQVADRHVYRGALCKGPNLVLRGDYYPEPKC